MADRKIVVCDVCDSIESTRYTITAPDAVYVVDLCALHAGDLMKIARAGTRGRKRGPRKRTEKVAEVPKRG